MKIENVMPESPSAMGNGNGGQSKSERQIPSSEFLLQQIKSLIAEAPLSIERELARGTNPWISCFSTVLTNIYTWFQLLNEKYPNSKKESKKAGENLQLILDRVEAVKKDYEAGKGVSPETQQELLAKLDIFRE